MYPYDPRQNQNMNNEMHGPYYSAPTQYPQQLQVPNAAGAQIYNEMSGPSGAPTPATPGGMLPLEQSYIENILRFNRGKKATFYFTYEMNPDWPSRVYEGIIDEAGRDHIIVRNEETGQSYLLLMVNLDYVEFDEPIEYVPPALPAPPSAQR